MLGTLTRPVETDVDARALALWRKYAPAHLTDLLPIYDPNPPIVFVSEPMRIASNTVDTVNTVALFYKPDQKRKMKGPGGGQFEETGAGAKHKSEAESAAAIKAAAKAQVEADKIAKKAAAAAKKANAKKKAGKKYAKIVNKEGIAQLAPGEMKVIDSDPASTATITAPTAEKPPYEQEAYWHTPYEQEAYWHTYIANVKEGMNAGTIGTYEGVQMLSLADNKLKGLAPSDTDGIPSKQVVGNPAGPGKALVYEGNKVTAYNHGKAQATLELGDPKLSKMLPKAMETLNNDQAGKAMTSPEYKEAQALKDLVWNVGKGHAFMLGDAEGKVFLKNLAEIQAYGHAITPAKEASKYPGVPVGWLTSVSNLNTPSLHAVVDELDKGIAHLETVLSTTTDQQVNDDLEKLKDELTQKRVVVMDLISSHITKGSTEKPAGNLPSDKALQKAMDGYNTAYKNWEAARSEHKAATDNMLAHPNDASAVQLTNTTYAKLEDAKLALGQAQDHLVDVKDATGKGDGPIPSKHDIDIKIAVISNKIASLDNILKDTPLDDPNYAPMQKERDDLANEYAKLTGWASPADKVYTDEAKPYTDTSGLVSIHAAAKEKAEKLYAEWQKIKDDFKIPPGGIEMGQIPGWKEAKAKYLEAVGEEQAAKIALDKADVAAQAGNQYKPPPDKMLGGGLPLSVYEEASGEATKRKKEAEDKLLRLQNYYSEVVGNPTLYDDAEEYKISKELEAAEEEYKAAEVSGFKAYNEWAVAKSDNPEGLRVTYESYLRTWAKKNPNVDPSTSTDAKSYVEKLQMIHSIHGLEDRSQQIIQDARAKKYQEGEQTSFQNLVDLEGNPIDPGRYDQGGTTFQTFEEDQEPISVAYEPLIESLREIRDSSPLDAISEYTGTGHDPLNKYLRTGDMQEPFDREMWIEDNFDTDQAMQDYIDYNSNDDEQTFREEHDYPEENTDDGRYEAVGLNAQEEYDKAVAKWDEEYAQQLQEYLDQKQQEYVDQAAQEQADSAEESYDSEGGGHDVDSMLNGLDAAFDQAGALAPYNMITFRKGELQEIEGGGTEEGEWEPGEILEDLGFISTSLSSSVSNNFSGTRFAIEIPKGQKAIYIAGASNAPSEYEMLLPRGSRFTRVGDYETLDSYGSSITMPRLRYLGTDYDPDNPLGILKPGEVEGQEPTDIKPGEEEMSDVDLASLGEWWSHAMLGPHKMQPASKPIKPYKPKKSKGKGKATFHTTDYRIASNTQKDKPAPPAPPDRFTWKPGDLKRTGKRVPITDVPVAKPTAPQKPEKGSTGTGTPGWFSNGLEWLSNARNNAALFFRTDQSRGWHGRWIDEGKRKVMQERTAGAAGSNTGGFYKGSDAMQRYVKEYDDPTQAYGEIIANEVYRALGVPVPEAVVFEHKGRTFYASDMVKDSTVDSQVGNLGLTRDRARKILDGFVADVLTANRDVLGMNLDNVLDVGGEVYRVDNGSAFLHRAQGERKTGDLDTIGEWESLAPGGRNDNYAQVFEAAGYDSPEDIPTLQRQLHDLADLTQTLGKGGWEEFVSTVAPRFTGPDRGAIVHMLEARSKRIASKTHATFFRTDQRRDWHGKWVDEGRAKAASVAVADKVESMDGSAGKPGVQIVNTPETNKYYDQQRSAWSSWDAMSPSDKQRAVVGRPLTTDEPFINDEKAKQPDKINIDNHAIINYAAVNGMTVSEYSRAAVTHLKGMLKNAKVVKRTHYETLMHIIFDGRIKSQFETQNSSGTLDNEWRATAEEAMFGHPETLHPTQRPIYAYLTDSPDTEAYAENVFYYGEYGIVLKDDVRDRTTFVFDDSLELPESPSPQLWPAPMNHPNLRVYSQSDIDIMDYEHVQDVSALYAEAQVHNGVGLSDIDHVLIPRGRDGEVRLIQELEAKGIKWRYFTK